MHVGPRSEPSHCSTRRQESEIRSEIEAIRADGIDSDLLPDRQALDRCNFSASACRLRNLGSPSPVLNWHSM